MIWSLIITALSIVCLLIASSVKKAGKELIILSTVIGVLVIHSAHDIFLEIESRNEDHQRLVDASFTFLYIPFFYVSQQVLFLKGKLSGYAKLFLVSTIVFAVFLYFLVTLRPSMELYCYANLIWSAGFLALLILWQRLLFLSLENRNEVTFDENLKSVHFISFQVLIPFFVEFISVLIPEGNFLASYQAFFTIKTTTNILETIMWVIMIINLYNIKKSYDITFSNSPSGISGLSEII